ncbi:Ig-like domain-containing protein [Collinsella sp. An307]|uniref:Ig-like domain-containing protein n=1 Tax=Collinsella sp. An307 TaxID=1965630 RepID=UPI0013028107|nr:Ig-like domain-containing protein [Collinsella sp. An307]
MLKRTIATVFVAALLSLLALPVTALAAENAPTTLYVGNYQITNGNATTYLKAGSTQGSLVEGSENDWTVKYDPSTATLTLNGATITGNDSISSVPYGAGIYAQSNSDQPVALTIELIGENTITGHYGIFVNAGQGTTPGADASLVIKNGGDNGDNGILTVTGTGGSGLLIIGGTGGASLTIKNASVDAKSTQTYSGYAGVCVQSGASATDSPNISLSVDGGSLTASGTGNNDGILFYVGSSQATGATTSLTVSENAIVDAKTGGIKASSSNLNDLSDQIVVGSGTGTSGGIVFDGTEGTVYGDVTLQENITINEGESLTIGDGASLNTGSHEVIVNGGTLTGEDKITGAVKYAPAITTESLPNGTVNEEYSQTLAATGSVTITWSLENGGTLPAGLKLENGVISGTPTAAGTSAFTVTATNAYGSDSKQLSISIEAQTDVPVTGVSLNKTELTLTEGSSETLVATITPADATNQKVTWNSTAPGVATVDASGTVIAVGAGTATITVTTTDGGKTATCTVTVKHDPAGAWSSDANGHWHACAACGDRLDFAAHTPKIEGAHGATCTEEGYTGDTACSVCGYEIAKGETVPAAGHEYEDDGHCAACDGIDPGFSPKIIAGADSTWQKGSAKNLTFTSNAAYEDFREVRLDGTAVDQKHFHVAEGSTVITLKASYLASLKLGSHELEIISTTGTAKTTFAVAEGKANETIVPTGDSPLPLLGSVAAIVLGVATILCGRALSREHQRL